MSDWLSGLIEGTATEYGDTVTVNGVSVQCIVNDADPGRVQQYLHMDEWTAPAYDLTLPAKVLNAPYSIKNGSEIYISKLGWSAIVRRISGPGVQDLIGDIYVLVVSVKRP